MIAILSLLIILTLSMMLTRIAAIALTVTGMASETAQFQARSAYTGVGFTTTEAESIMAHPVRRRIIMLLMIMGNVGVATIVATAIVSYYNTARSDFWWVNLLVLLIGIFILYKGATNTRIEKWLNGVIRWGLKRWTNLEVRDTVTILQLEAGFMVGELKVEQGDWLEGKSLREAALASEGVLILGIQHEDGSYRGAPRAEESIAAGDTLVLYAKNKRIAELDQRIKGFHGEIAHREAVESFQENREEENLPGH